MEHTKKHALTTIGTHWHNMMSVWSLPHVLVSPCVLLLCVYCRSVRSECRMHACLYVQSLFAQFQLTVACMGEQAAASVEPRKPPPTSSTRGGTSLAAGHAAAGTGDGNGNARARGRRRSARTNGARSGYGGQGYGDTEHDSYAWCWAAATVGWRWRQQRGHVSDGHSRRARTHGASAYAAAADDDADTAAASDDGGSHGCRPRHAWVPSSLVSG